MSQAHEATADEATSSSAAAEAPSPAPRAPEPEAPGLPSVRDEASDTPWWVPVVGLVLALAVVAFIGWRMRSAAGEAVQGEPSDSEVTTPAGEGGGGAARPSEP